MPKKFEFVLDSKQNRFCDVAVKQLTDFLVQDKEWAPFFAIDNPGPDQPVGKMFGVLVVETEVGELGYLSAFSGKLDGSNHHPGFVPPVFDTLSAQGFLNPGMIALGQMTARIQEIEAEGQAGNELRIETLKAERREHSHALQKRVFESYSFLNRAGEAKNLLEIFEATPKRVPPAGAGECAAPKLLQYAFQHNLKPIAIAEFWWGRPRPKSARQHGHFYRYCQDKCAPILGHMLAGD